LLDSCLQGVKAFSPTLAPIPFTAPDATGLVFSSESSLLRLQHTTPHHKPHGLPKKRKRNSPTSVPPCAACVLCWSFGISLSLVTHSHTLSHRERHSTLAGYSASPSSRQEGATRLVSALLSSPPDRNIVLSSGLIDRCFLCRRIIARPLSSSKMEGVRCVLLDIGKLCTCVVLCVELRSSVFLRNWLRGHIFGSGSKAGSKSFLAIICPASSHWSSRLLWTFSLHSKRRLPPMISCGDKDDEDDDGHLGKSGSLRMFSVL